MPLTLTIWEVESYGQVFIGFSLPEAAVGEAVARIVGDAEVGETVGDDVVGALVGLAVVVIFPTTTDDNVTLP
jgi:hypothetical protein|eukprot:6953237-Pyramimonas_sp.AAC.1